MEDKEVKIYKGDSAQDILDNVDGKWKPENLIASIKGIKVDLGSVLKINNKIYSVGCRNTKTGNVAVNEIELKEDVEECVSEPNIICPVCGSENCDSWEIGANEDDDYYCSSCKSTLSWQREVEVTYSTQLVKRGEVVEIQNEDLLEAGK